MPEQFVIAVAVIATLIFVLILKKRERTSIKVMLTFVTMAIVSIVMASMSVGDEALNAFFSYMALVCMIIALGAEMLVAFVTPKDREDK